VSTFSSARSWSISIFRGIPNASSNASAAATVKRVFDSEEQNTIGTDLDWQGEALTKYANYRCQHAKRKKSGSPPKKLVVRLRKACGSGPCRSSLAMSERSEWATADRVGCRPCLRTGSPRPELAVSRFLSASYAKKHVLYHQLNGRRTKNHKTFLETALGLYGIVRVKPAFSM
jgi:hypothetical protein